MSNRDYCSRFKRESFKLTLRKILADIKLSSLYPDLNSFDVYNIPAKLSKIDPSFAGLISLWHCKWNLFKKTTKENSIKGEQFSNYLYLW